MRILVDSMPQSAHDCPFSEDRCPVQWDMSCRLSKNGQDDCCLEHSEECPYFFVLDSSLFISKKEKD